MDNRKRRIFSLLLGSLLGGSIGWSLSGGWDRLSLMNIPIKQGSGDLVGLGIGGVLGLCWGYLIARPRRWWIGMLAGGIYSSSVSPAQKSSRPVLKAPG